MKTYKRNGWTIQPTANWYGCFWGIYDSEGRKAFAQTLRAAFNYTKTHKAA